MSVLPQTPLSQLRDKLARRIGHGSASGASAVHIPLLTEHLDMAQSELLRQFRSQLLTVLDESLTTVNGQEFYDIPADCDPLETTEIATQASGNTWWQTLEQSIPTGYRHESYAGQPQRWDYYYTGANVQFEIWPRPNDAYPLRLKYQKALSPLIADTDVLSVDEDLALLYATTTLKYHYRMPDAESYSQRLDRMLGALRAKQHGDTHYRVVSRQAKARFHRPTLDGVVVGSVGSLAAPIESGNGGVFGDSSGVVFDDGTGIII